MSVLGTLIANNLAWDAIERHLPAKRKSSPQQFVNFDCPLCDDRRRRCGVKHSGTGVGINCFHCGFKLQWRIGEVISRPLETFLTALGMPSADLIALKQRAFQNRSMLRASPHARAVLPSLTARPSFGPMPLPPDAFPLSFWADEGCEDPDFLDAAAYIQSRGDAIFEATDFFWSPSNRMSRRIIVPARFGDQIVGWTSRAIDAGVEPRYYGQMPPDLLFNWNVLDNRQWVYAILVEGIFDALAVNGVATMGARLNDQQAMWLKATGKTIIVVPDKDQPGQRLIDMALKHGFSVAFPSRTRSGAPLPTDWWDPDVKDCAEAARRYGKLFTVQSIFATKFNDPTMIKMIRQYF